MLNMIKMDLYRMFRTKSLYVIWIVLAVALLITTSLCKTDYDSLNEEPAPPQNKIKSPLYFPIPIPRKQYSSPLPEIRMPRSLSVP